jgi:mRNA deadenylase 3'-5' endonuclease subunit Ccr4
LASAYAQHPTDDNTGEPKYTSFHARFKGTVDYIWYSSQLLDCLRVAEMLPSRILFKNKELPNQYVT